MARVSFTLRSTDSERGSYLRYDESLSYEASAPGGSAASVPVRVDYDSALRADGILIAPPVFDEFFLDATSVCYGEVSLNWQVNVAPTLSASPQVMGVVLVYSPLGEPQTIASGQVLVESSNTFSFEHTGLAEGKWAYYSLFVNFRSSGGDNYYERVASISELVPKNYGSNMALWKRIPLYYRLQDSQLGTTDYSPCVGTVPEDGVVGPLYKMLSVIGFDIDRLRTLIDYVMVAQDPALSHTETLDAIVDQYGILLRSTDLGAQRARALVNDVGFFRRSKGTVEGIEFFAKSVTGSEIEIDQVTGEIKVYSQRVNYITVPKDGAGIVSHRPANVSEETELGQLDFSDTSWSAYSGSYSYTGTQFVGNGTGASAGVTHVLIQLSSPVPVRNDGTDRVVFSVNSGVGTDAIKWVRLTDATETVVGWQNRSITSNGVRAFEVLADGASAGAGWLNTKVELLVDLSEVAAFGLSSLLAERNFVGSYFDGDTVRGGWLIDTGSVSDYRWAGAANNSVSIFAEEYERTKGIIDQLLWEVFPITEVSKYSIVLYNGIPGIS